MQVLKLVFPMLLCATMVAQKPTPLPKAPAHTGIWWGDKSGLYKEAFIVGYKSGSLHAAGHSTDVNKFAGTILVAGVDKFYHDFRNRSILVDDALKYVAEEMRGVPDDQLKIELDHLRAAAALPPATDE